MATSLDYNHTAAGPLGSHRETMLQNQLLLRPQLGRALRRGYACPSDGFTYGKPNSRIDGGAAEALGVWNSGEAVILPFKRQERRSDRDFISLNRAAVQSGLTSTHEQYQFRATHDVRKKPLEEEKNKARTRRIPPSMVFGISTRPSTPIFDLLEHKYQDKWLQERRQAEVNLRAKEENKKQTSGKVFETRASLLRTYQNPVDSAPLWQMERFSKSAQPHLETFRSPSARARAFSYHASDSISRRGAVGNAHGIYESAKS